MFFCEVLNWNITKLNSWLFVNLLWSMENEKSTNNASTNFQPISLLFSGCAFMFLPHKCFLSRNLLCLIRTSTPLGPLELGWEQKYPPIRKPLANFLNNGRNLNYVFIAQVKLFLKHPLILYKHLTSNLMYILLNIQGGSKG